MKVSGFSPISSGLIALAIISAVLAFLVLSPDSTANASFTPTLTIKLCNALPANFPNPAPLDAQLAGNPACVDNKTAEAAADNWTKLDIPAADMNFSLVVTFTHSRATITPGGNIPPGEKVGGLTSQATLAVASGACKEIVTVPFILYNIKIPTGRGDGANIYTPLPEGTSDNGSAGDTSATAIIRGRLQNGTTLAANGTKGFPATGHGDGIPDLAPSGSDAIQKYPDWLLDLFDPDWLPISPPLDGPENPGGSGKQNANDGPLQPVLPLAVYGGMTAPEPASSDWVPLYFLQFSPGALATAGFGATHPFTQLTADKGYASVVVLNDTSTVSAGISPITDFCAPLISETMLLGTTPVSAGCPVGCVRAKNPKKGPATSTSIVNSLRDLDGDGLENSFDTCPSILSGPAQGFDPRIAGPGGIGGAQDPDSDAIPTACDPTPGTNTAGSHQCPGEFLPGPHSSDHDGDCFPNAEDNCPLVANGLTVPPGFAPAGDGQLESEALQAGYPADGGPKTDSIGDACDADDNNPDGGFASVNITNQICIATPYAWAVPANDNDCDGYTNNEETLPTGATPPIGTNPNNHCGTEWPPNLNTTGTGSATRIDIFDVNALAPPVFFSTFISGSPNYSARKDLNRTGTGSNGRIDIFDVNKMAPPIFFSTCTP